MSSKDFDKEIDALYQQRKSQLVVPDSKFSNNEQKVKATQPLLRKAFILFTAGFASFGIFAIISHLATPPANKGTTQTIQHVVNVIESKPVGSKNAESDIVIPVKPTLPTRTNVISVIAKPKSSNVFEPETVQANDMELALESIETVALPKITAPEIPLTPLYKVMPEYSSKAITRNYTGEVKLTYKISAKGEVTDINITESNANKLLEKSAKKALSKWQYQAGEHYQQPYEIVFEFKLKE